MSERRTPPSVFRKRQAAIGATLLTALFLVVFSGFVPVANAISFPISPAVQVNTATGSQLYPALYGGSCTYQSYFYSWWVDPTGSLYMSSSQNGVTFSTPVNELTLTSLGTGETTATSSNAIPWKAACSGNVFLIVWTSVNSGSSANTLTNFIFYAIGVMSGGTAVMGSIVQGPFTSGSHLLHAAGAGALNIGCVNYISGVVYYCTNTGAGNAMNLEDNNVVQANFSAGSYGSATYQLMNSGSAFMLYDSVNCRYAVSGDAITWPGSPTSLPTDCTTNQASYSSDGVGIGGSFYIPSQQAGASWVQVLSSGGTVTSTLKWYTAGLAAAVVQITTDGLGDFVVVGCPGASMSCQYAISTNSLASASAASAFSLTGGTLGTGQGFYGFSTEPIFSSTLAAFAVETVTTSASFFVYETVFGIPGSASSITQSVTIGSCPTKNTVTTALTNQTLIGYTGLTFASQTLNTITTEVASVNSGHVASETLYMVVYLGSAPGAITAGNPLLMIGVKTWVLTATSAPQQLSWAPNVNLGSLGAGVTYYVALYGNSKILINDSSLSGMFTSTGSAGTPPVSVSAISTSGTQLYLCATSTYQSVFTTTVTSTSTSTVTSGGTATTTVSTTTTLTSLSSNAALGNSVGIAFVLLILLAPAFAIAVPIGVYTKSPIGVGLGFVAGLAIGALLGNQGGLIPLSVLAGMMVVIVLLIVGFLFALKSGQG